MPACLSLRLRGQKKKQVQVRSMFKSSSLDPRTWNAGKESESEEDHSSPTSVEKGTSVTQCAEEVLIMAERKKLV